MKNSKTKTFRYLRLIAACCLVAVATAVLVDATKHRASSNEKNSLKHKVSKQHQAEKNPSPPAAPTAYRIVTGNELYLATSVVSVPEGQKINMLTGSTTIGSDGNAYVALTRHGLVKVGHKVSAATSVGKISGTVVALHPTEDLGMVRLDVPQGVTIPAVELASEGTMLDPLRPLTVISGNHPNHVGKLVVQRKRLFGEAIYSRNKHVSNIVLTPRVWSGASGSGAYVDDQLVAIVWGSNDKENTCLATDYRFIRELMAAVAE